MLTDLETVASSVCREGAKSIKHVWTILSKMHRIDDSNTCALNKVHYIPNTLSGQYKAAPIMTQGASMSEYALHCRGASKTLEYVWFTKRGFTFQSISNLTVCDSNNYSRVLCLRFAHGIIFKTSIIRLVPSKSQIFHQCQPHTNK